MNLQKLVTKGVATTKLSWKSSLVWLGIWMGVGILVRFFNLTGKPPWTDEFATMVLSLGNSFQSVPLDQVISLETLLQPLRPDPSLGSATVIHRLLSEDNHPPFYFVLVHEWMKLWPQAGEYISLWAARSLPALFGVLSIPAIYGLSWLAFRSPLVAQFSAAMMAVSPYGVFIAQEARHYSFAVLWVIASLCCFVEALRRLQEKKPIPLWLVLSWIIVNSLGMATHYFFGLTLAAEGLAMLGLSVWQGSGISLWSSLGRLLAVGLGTIAGSLVWVTQWQSAYGSEMTQWIYSESRSGLEWVSPIFQALAAWLTMVALLPIEVDEIPIVVFFVLMMAVFFVWAIPIFYRGIQAALKDSQLQLGTFGLGSFVLSAIAIFFGITYFYGTDLTRGARYNFVYFPAVIALVGVSLKDAWQGVVVSKFGTIQGQKAVSLIWIMGLLSALTVAGNLGYQKYYRPDRFLGILQQASQAPILIATTHRSLVHVGETMGVAWEMQRQNFPLKPQFLLAKLGQDPNQTTQTFKTIVQSSPRPLDVWAVNFKAPIDLPNCQLDGETYPGVEGYDYKLYHCQ